jgi:hypothetical protein
MNGLSPQRELVRGDVAQFHFLHLGQIAPGDCKVEGPSHDGSYLYKVNGKPRLMLVLGKIREGFNGVRWYWVLMLTSKKNDVNWNKHNKYVRLGPIVEATKISYTDAIVHAYPDNLLCDVKSRLDTLTLTNLLKVSGLILGPPQKPG